MMEAISVPCGHCGARATEPCRSVGGRVIVSPHMKRLDAIGATNGRGDIRAADQAYCDAALLYVFGHVTPELRQRALKDRSIDERKPWVRQALARPVASCDHRKVVEETEEHYDPLFGDVPTEVIVRNVCDACGAEVSA